jgi:hypothetical protein
MIAPQMPGRGATGRGARLALTGTPPSYATPDVLNNASFDTDWEGFTDINGPGHNPTGVTRATDQAYSGTTSVKGTWSGDNGGSIGSFWKYSMPSTYDRLWARLYFRLSSGWDITTINKFWLFREASGGNQFGGFELAGPVSIQSHGQGLSFTSFNENSSKGVLLVPAANITTDTWHSLEVDNKRNGDTLPNAAFWYDGVQITQPDGPDPGEANLIWSGGRLNFGPTRGHSGQIGMMQFLGTLNAGNTGSGSVWLDRIAISSVGRIGP